jgi:hypothetical protein
MNDARRNSGSSPPKGFAGGRAIASSLFGGAILATVGTASQAQVKYVDSIVSIGTMMIPSGTYVVAGGNLALGDGGGGAFMPGGTVCNPDKGIVFQDNSSPKNCFYRADPTYSVRARRRRAGSPLGMRDTHYFEDMRRVMIGKW